MLITLEIPSNDKSYDWFLRWMAAHQRAPPRTPPPLFTQAGILARIQPAPRQLAVETTYIAHASGGFSTSFALLPGTGRHLLNFHGTLLRVQRERDAKRIDLQRGTPWELLTLTTLFSERRVFPALLAEARALAEQQEQGKTVIYTAWSTNWQPFGAPRRKRPLSSVVLAPGLKQRLVSDAQTFLHSSQWYHDRGIPYRRGYLLYGPPGTGKTSFVQALAAELDYAICVVNLSERGLTDDRLNHLLANLPERSIALLEDVDAAFAARRVVADADGYTGANVTFSGLLNALDGVASADQRIIIMTTNYIERLDDALVRPGRVDVRAEIGYAGEEVVLEMWERFYGAGCGLDMADEERDAARTAFVGMLRERGAFAGLGWGVSAAALQGLFVLHKGLPWKAVQEVDTLVPEGARRA